MLFPGSDDPPRPAEGSSLQFDMSGYMAARADFMVEHDNYAELNLHDTEFNKETDELMIGGWRRGYQSVSDAVDRTLSVYKGPVCRKI